MTRSNINFVEICTVSGLGHLQGTPQPVSGGLVHRMWRVDTDKGSFAMKVLNEEIMARPDAKSNYRLSERVAIMAHRNGIPAVLAKMTDGDPWIELDGHYVMVFNWVEGHSLVPEQCTDEHSKSIGQLLFQLHNLRLQFDDWETPTTAPITEDTWQSHIEQAEQTISCWGFSHNTLLRGVLSWSRLYEGATEALGGRLIISHRDLDCKNVIWAADNTPFLIDWESAGYIHPTVELVEGAINWSRSGDGTFNKKRFQVLIQTYLGAGGKFYGNSVDAVYGTLGGSLGWLEYNMRRSIEQDKFDSDQRELGKRQVQQTIRELYGTNTLFHQYGIWIDELLK
ncbi:phosphotransferase [Alicyclobacillus sp. ALC3]|uniref:phosphotransferase n=1 Tax=Alicyclobacillus sp. ALC3 TaxID=2796143 RepID=UPI002379D49D|nr:phosphotransferase [Alicyclobacillus sp. ALC3]